MAAASLILVFHQPQGLVGIVEGAFRVLFERSRDVEQMAAGLQQRQPLIALRLQHHGCPQQAQQHQGNGAQTDEGETGS